MHRVLHIKLKFCEVVFRIFVSNLIHTTKKDGRWERLLNDQSTEIIYLSAAVSVLTNSPKISDQTERKVFQLNLSQIDEKLG